MNKPRGVNVANKRQIKCKVSLGKTRTTIFYGSQFDQIIAKARMASVELSAFQDFARFQILCKKYEIILEKNTLRTNG